MQVECHFRHKGELQTVEVRSRRFPCNTESVGLACKCRIEMSKYTLVEQAAIRQEFPNTVRCMRGGLFGVFLCYCGGNPKDVWRAIREPNALWSLRSRDYPC
jgi:hypothetical protein